MDGFSAVIGGAQAAAYTLSIVKSLTELRNALQNGRGYLRNEREGIQQLQHIIIRLLPNDDKAPDPRFERLLQSINVTVDSLLLLFQQHKRLQLIALLIIRRAEVNESFAVLERKKNTLILYLTAQNSTDLAFLKTSMLPQPERALEMSQYFEPAPKDSTDESTSHSLYRSVQCPELDERQSVSKDSTDESISYLLHQSVQCPELDERSFPTAPQTVNHAPGLGRAPVNTDQSPSPLEKQRPKTLSTGPIFIGNTVTDGGRQKIYISNRQGLNGEYYENSVTGFAIQNIGTLDRRLSSKRNRWLKSVVSPKMWLKNPGGILAKKNKASDGAEQNLYAPSHASIQATYENNRATKRGKQYLGLDVNLQQSTGSPE